MTTVTLGQLLQQRDESLRVHRAPAITRLARRLRTLDLAPVRRAIAVSLLAVAGFMMKHALVLGGCAAMVISAATVSATLGWITTGAALFFLEARRR